MAESAMSCPKCRRLISAAVHQCPFCGKRISRYTRYGRFFDGAIGSRVYLYQVFLVMNLVIYGAMLILGGTAEQAKGDPLSLATPNLDALIHFGIQSTMAISDLGDWWRLVTSIFIHLSILHLGFNLLALYYVGRMVENTLGASRFVVFYVLTGITASIASYAFGKDGAGASGALFGMIGVLAAFGFRLGGLYGKTILRFMLRWALYGLLFGFLVPNINNIAHIFGLISGALLGYLFLRPLKERTPPGLTWNFAALAGVLLVVVSFLIAGLLAPYRLKGKDFLKFSALVSEVGHWVEDVRQAQEARQRSNALPKLRRIRWELERAAIPEERCRSFQKELLAGLAAFQEMESAGPQNRQDLALENLEKIIKRYFEWGERVRKRYGLRGFVR